MVESRFKVSGPVLIAVRTPSFSGLTNTGQEENGQRQEENGSRSRRSSPSWHFEPNIPGTSYQSPIIASGVPSSGTAFLSPAFEFRNCHGCGQAWSAAASRSPSDRWRSAAARHESSTSRPPGRWRPWCSRAGGRSTMVRFNPSREYRRWDLNPHALARTGF
jgi:hypothetical protein